MEGDASSVGNALICFLCKWNIVFIGLIQIPYVTENIMSYDPVNLDYYKLEKDKGLFPW